MRAFKQEKKFFRLLFAMMLCISLIPNGVLADDKKDDSKPMPAISAKAALIGYILFEFLRKRF